MPHLRYYGLIGATCMLLVAFAVGNFMMDRWQRSQFDEEPLPPIVHASRAAVAAAGAVEAATAEPAADAAAPSPLRQETPAPPAPPDAIPATAVESDPGDGLTASEEHALLQLHDQVRAEVGVGPLRWSDTLAQSAAAWATTLQGRDCAIDHSGGPYGENIYYSREYGAGQAPRTAKEVMDAFLKEASAYDHDANTCASGDMCGHYTQIVWAATSEVGCAKRLCLGDDRKEVWVCHYDPRGNIIGQRPY